MRARGKGTGHHQLRFQLFGERADQLHTQGVGFYRGVPGRHSAPIIGDGELKAAGTTGEGNVQVALGKAPKSVLVRIGHQFVHHQAQRAGLFGAHDYRGQVRPQLDGLLGRTRPPGRVRVGWSPASPAARSPAAGCFSRGGEFPAAALPFRPRPGSWPDWPRPAGLSAGAAASTASCPLRWSSSARPTAATASAAARAGCAAQTRRPASARSAASRRSALAAGPGPAPCHR
nr:hypothetical protein [Tanacetum cinerariifolium]